MLHFKNIFYKSKEKKEMEFVLEKAIFLKTIMEHLGKNKAILFVILISTVISILLYFFFIYFFHFTFSYEFLFITLIIPLIVSPIVSWYLINFLFQMIDLEKKMRKLATKDSLTQLPNRQSFLQSIQLLYTETKKNRTYFTVVYIDVDDFKKINDNYGHTIGDKVLQSLGNILETNKRKNDLVGRLGGEEFAYALPERTLEEAYLFIERIRQIVEKNIFQHHGVVIKYTLSFGLSIYNEKNNISLDKLISQADTALYKAKAEGKNTIRTYICV